MSHERGNSELLLGVIARLQVQRDPLKEKGVGYDPTAILGVDEAAIGPQGMVGRYGDGWILDAHHTAHPRNRAAGRRALSIGFTGHYDRMAERFGSAALGCAGENIIVANDDRLMEADLAGTIVIMASDGDVELHRARIATPCAEFTSWIKGLDTVLTQREQPEDIAFLDDGMRGYILDVAHLERPMTVRVGDKVVLRRDA